MSHTYGSTCHLARNVSFTGPSPTDDIPGIKAQFFYSSPLPIDDPLSAVPQPTGSEDPSKHPLRPYSAYDNNLLEEAWLSLASKQNRKKHYEGKPPKLDGKGKVRGSSKDGKSKGKQINRPSELEGSGSGTVPYTRDSSSSKTCPCKCNTCKCDTDSLDIGVKCHCTCSDCTKAAERKLLSTTAPASKLKTAERQAPVGENTTASGDNNGEQQAFTSFEGGEMRDSSLSQQNSSDNIDISHRVGLGAEESFKDLQSEQHTRSDIQVNSGVESTKLGSQNFKAELSQSNIQMDGAPDARTSGKPFLKYTSDPENENQNPHIQDGVSMERGDQLETEIPETETMRNTGCNAHKIKDQVEVPVGISRLHHVELPTLLMKPIYWSPVHDIAVVTRGTWFYKDTMYPIEPDVANRLESGYRELRPWSRTWNDELNSAIEVGAAGEEKIAYPLWSQENDKSLSTSPQCAARCFEGHAAAEGKLTSSETSGKGNEKTVVKRYSHSKVIYKDAQNAFLLRPNLQPSAYYNRTPLRKIRKGTSVGIHCVRGFDWKTWENLHPSKKSKTTVKAENAACASGNSASDTTSHAQLCSACRSQEERPKVSDLILVIHGIGQKLSERVESFHFTHAINSFRRSLNVELVNEQVQRVLRPDHGGVMVLPVNWRSNLSFEDGGPMKPGDNQRASDFTLRDITPKSIPAVRNLISDVMLDIPFYMSHHKPKMIKAVILEANRVYRLWCQNNPDFSKNGGRVHIIAHSLGSPMAMEVLSKQPTSVPTLDVFPEKINSEHFDFNTTNLFFVGSPAGFFLLLDRGNLTPRRGIGKPDAISDQDPAVTGEAGFGCLAVGNVYNIIHQNDPIAYRLNATVDAQFAASLKTARVPSATTGVFESISNAVKSITPGVAPPKDAPVGQLVPKMTLPRLPSQLEMDIHDFTREEIAEKKFYLLNDNGQVDWFLTTGGGLEIQYLNMLGAHSSYWASADFIRLVIVEVGRTPGRNHALPNMRAAKIGVRIASQT